ncbi:MAG: hypothetical protein V3T83_12160 [Acidobacteriota bacterium]
MDENRPAQSMHAPGAASASSSYRLPGASSPLRVDDHVVEPESSRREVMIGGRIVQALAANAPHGTQNAALDYILYAHLAPGYIVANDLLTRFDERNDFASDTAVLKGGTDPATGRRYLEELAFEVVSEQQSEKVVTAKAPTMLRRGVRRVFALFLRKGEMREWRSGEDALQGGRWVLLDPDSSIEDPALSRPVPIRAVLDAAHRDEAVAEALLARGTPVLRRNRAEAIAEGKADAILTVLEKRGLAPDADARSSLRSCKDLKTLDRWLERALAAGSLADVFTAP